MPRKQIPSEAAMAGAQRVYCGGLERLLLVCLKTGDDVCDDAYECPG
jgi:hypothetical protein